MLAMLGRFAVLIPVLGAVALPASTAAAATQSARPVAAAPRSVVVVAVPGLQWSNVTAADTPQLWSFAQTAARGVLSVKTAHGTATCSAAMATLGAGNRAIGTPAMDRFCANPDATPPPAADWTALLHANRGQLFGTQPGALGAALGNAGLSVRALGAGGAALAVAGPAGTIARATAPLATLTVVEAAELYDVAPPARRAAAHAVDNAVTPWLDLARTGSLVFVVGAGDSPHGPAGLRVALVRGAGFESGRLTSDSTGRTPYLELIDVAPTILTALQVDVPTSMAGQPMRVSSRSSFAGDMHDFLDRSKHARQRGHYGGLIVRIVVSTAAAACLAGGAVLYFASRRRRLNNAVEMLCYVASALPFATYVLDGMPWWRWSMAVVIAIIAAIDLVVAAMAYAAARRVPRPRAPVDRPRCAP